MLSMDIVFRIIALEFKLKLEVDWYEEQDYK